MYSKVIINIFIDTNYSYYIVINKAIINKIRVLYIDKKLRKLNGFIDIVKSI